MVAAPSVRVLLVADSHVGLGAAHLRNLERALEPAHRGEVDLVVHGGDLLYRSRVPADLVGAAFEPLKAVASRGIPVFVVPGNHERGRIPYPLLACHPGVHVFHGPGTFTGVVRGLRIAVSGFPFARDVSAEAFRALLAATAWKAHPADLRLLALHQAVEGARVGAHDYTFRHGVDVVEGRALPAGFAAVLAGHIHRSQVLTHDLGGRPLGAPVLYPGSVERTSHQERGEAKGYLLADVVPGRDGGRLERWSFVSLEAPALRGEHRARD